MDRICTASDIKIDKNNYLSHRTICKNCHNKNRKKTVITRQSKINNTHPLKMKRVLHKIKQN